MAWMDGQRRTPKSIRPKIVSFLARFALIAGCIFLIWLEIEHGYIRFLDELMLFGFSLFGRRFHPLVKTSVYYETFSIVTFTSVVLATRSTPWTTKAKQLAAGLGFLFFTHLFHRIDNFLVFCSITPRSCRSTCPFYSSGNTCCPCWS